MLSQEHSLGAGPRVETPETAPSAPDDNRANPRVPFLGYPFRILATRMCCFIRLRDLSCGGASGLCDEPLEVGAFVTVCFTKEHLVEAEVRWVRLMNVGLKFAQPLPPAFVRWLQQAHGTFVTTRSNK